MIECLGDRLEHSLSVIAIQVRGLLFKFVDFLHSSSEVFDRVIRVISSENVFFPYLLMYKA